VNILENKRKVNNLILGRITIITFIQIFLVIYSFIYSHKIDAETFNILTIINIFSVMSCMLIFKVIEKDFNSNILNIIITSFDTAYISSVIFMTGYNKSPFILLLPIYIFFTSLVFKTKGVIFSTTVSTIIVIINYQITSPSSNDFSYSVSIVCTFILFGIISNYFVEKTANTQTKLNTLNKLSKILIEKLNLGIITINKKGFISYTNQIAEKILGSKKDISSFLNELTEASNKEPHKLEVKPGVFVFTYNITTDNTTTLIIKDISKDEKIDKLQFISTVAAVLAHEIKNPVSSIAGVSELIKSDKKILSNIKSKDKLLGIIDRESERLTSLAEEFLIYSGSEKRKEEPVNIIALVRSSCDNLRANSEFINKQLTLDLVTPDSSECIISGDYQRISQALENIMLNAIQASSQGSAISCATACDENKVNIIIADHGTGIPDEIKEKIFDPFFTTKEKGTGLGLSISKNIITAHSGHISIETSKEGSVFKITFKIKRGI
jgi:signal transduction histidine kinase